MEQILEKKITGALLGIRLGTKTHTDAMDFIEKLRRVNRFLAEEFDQKLLNTIRARKA
jgi:hypothetical protein